MKHYSTNRLILNLETYNSTEFTSKFSMIKIDYAWINSPFGKALIMKTDKGLCGLAFSKEIGQFPTLMDMTGRWKNGNFIENISSFRKWSEFIFSGSGELALQLVGTPFQIRVWKVLLKIPRGQTTSYSEIAIKIGSPKSTRAVASAIGRNPISWLIPCHRALRKSGMLGGYHWGITIKEKMLNYEKTLN